MPQMEEVLNKSTADEFNMSWIIKRDKGIIEWFNKYYPRFICIGRKIHPFGYLKLKFNCLNLWFFTPTPKRHSFETFHINLN